MQKVGEVIHYFQEIEVGAIRLTDNLQVGDRVKIQGNTTDFEQVISSIQIEDDSVEEAGPGDEIGTKVEKRVRQGDEVYKLEEGD